MGETAVTIGSFDGVHLGHAALVRTARSRVGSGGRVVAMAFDPHPASVLAPGREPARLTGYAHRAELLRDAGADEVVQLEPTDRLLGQSPEEFVEDVLAGYGPSVFVEGEDFVFGRGRSGNVGVLSAMGAERGFAVDVVPPVDVDLCDQTVVRCSSTITRWLLAHGRVEDAARVLGRPYEVRGSVRRGDQRGRTIGFPTANVRTEQVLPKDGVYAGVAVVGGASVPAAVHVGPRSTFGAMERTMEAHLIGWSPEPGMDEYGWAVCVRLHRWVRGHVRFSGPDALVEQLGRDVRRASEMVGVSADEEAPA